MTLERPYIDRQAIGDPFLVLGNYCSICDVIMSQKAEGVLHDISAPESHVLTR